MGDRKFLQIPRCGSNPSSLSSSPIPRVRLNSCGSSKNSVRSELESDRWGWVRNEEQEVHYSENDSCDCNSDNDSGIDKPEENLYDYVTPSSFYNESLGKSPAQESLWPFDVLKNSPNLRRKHENKEEQKETRKLSTCDHDENELGIIGENLVYKGPFGFRKCIYLDQTASGKAVAGIENFIRTNVLPNYANTHSTTSYCASRMMKLREEARNVVHEMCGGEKEDVVIFVGNGMTGAIHKLIGSIIKPQDPSPIVIVGPFEHHSNLLPWREITKDIIVIPENSRGLLNVKYLEKVLKSLKTKNIFKKQMVIAAFSAGSNVTGVMTDDVHVTTLLHKFGAISVWDYAAAAPHVQVRMNPKTGNEELDKLAQKDAIVFSGHKFLGGPQTPGVLLAKKSIFRNPVPHGHGGGSVLFVTGEKHMYLKDLTERNEAGTPNIVGAIRLGLVFQLQDSIGVPYIIKRESDFTRQVLDAWTGIPEIKILGPTQSSRLPIISLMIMHSDSGYFLHHDFIVAILNDLFGIQCRGGCMCAGPYGLRLLGIGGKAVKKYEEILSAPRKLNNGENKEDVYDAIFKPGYIRISLPYHASQEEIQFTIDSVKLIASEGWKLLPFYGMDASKASFRFCGEEFTKTSPLEKEEATIKSFNVYNMKKDFSDFSTSSSSKSAPSYKECLKYAKDLIHAAQEMTSEYEMCFPKEYFTPDLTPFRWFLLPSEAFFCMKNTLRVKELFKGAVRPFTPQQNYKSNIETSHDGSISHTMGRHSLTKNSKNIHTLNPRIYKASSSCNLSVEEENKISGWQKRLNAPARNFKSQFNLEDF